MNNSRHKYIKIVTTLGWIALGTAWSIVALQLPFFEENQNTKFLHAAAETGYGFLSHDWMANTIDPLPAFTFLIGSLFRLHSVQMIYLMFPALLAILLWSLSAIADRLYGIRSNTAAMALFLAFLFIEEKNMQLGFGTQYLIGHYLQPCVFGVFIILAIERFLAGSRLWASASLALAAAFHPAYMPSALLIQGSFTALTIYQEKRISRDALIPLFFFIVLSAPLVIRYKLLFAYTTPEMGVKAMQILSTQRISTHTNVRSWLNYEDYIGMGLIMLSMVMTRKSPLFWIMLPLALLIAVTVPLLYFISWPSLEVLTPWRTSAILLPLAYTILAGWFAAKLMPLANRYRMAGYLMFTIGCAGVAMPVIRHLPEQLSLLKNGKQVAASPVTEFARKHSNQHDLWLVPTRDNQFDSFRLTSGSPVLINWKTHPYKDVEILEWYRRNKDAESFYQNEAGPSGAAILRKLHFKYGVTHAIVDGNVPETHYAGMHICWKGPGYMVIGIHN